MDPNSCDLYAGLSGFELGPDEFKFGHGVVLSKTYAHFMAPFMMAFKRAELGKVHPAPWKAAAGGLGYDISAQLFVPLDLTVPGWSDWFDRLNTVWWFTALMRLKGSSLAFTPLLASESFSSMLSMEGEPHTWPVEVHTRRLVPESNPAKIIAVDALAWIEQHWVSGGVLMCQNSDFSIAFQAFDACTWTSTPSLALVSLWGGLERLFSPSNQELKFRVSALIASFLERPGKERLACYQRVKKLYDARSRAAHRASHDEIDALVDTYALMKRVLTKIIEDNHIPTTEQLEGQLLGEQG